MGDINMEQIKTNKKGLIPTQDQALQTKKERACMMILRSGVESITGLEIQDLRCH